VPIFEYDSDSWHNKIIFRNYLKNHPKAAEEYEKLKKKLSIKYIYDRDKYTIEKLYFVNKILQLAKNK